MNYPLKMWIIDVNGKSDEERKKGLLLVWKNIKKVGQKIKKREKYKSCFLIENYYYYSLILILLLFVIKRIFMFS